jgi:hypothetical protein
LLVGGTVADAQLEVALRRELAGQFDASDDDEDSQQEASGASTRFDSTHGYCRFPKRWPQKRGYLPLPLGYWDLAGVR